MVALTATSKTHLGNAKDCIRRSDAALLEASEHIRNAMRDDASLTLDAVGTYVQRSGDWVRALLRWAETAEEGESLFSYDREARLRRAFRQAVRELSPEDLIDGFHYNELTKLTAAAYARDYPNDYTSAGRPSVSKVEHFRTYALRSFFGLKYDWEHLSAGERATIAPELRAWADGLNRMVEELLEQEKPRLSLVTLGDALRATT